MFADLGSRLGFAFESVEPQNQDLTILHLLLSVHIFRPSDVLLVFFFFFHLPISRQRTLLCDFLDLRLFTCFSALLSFLSHFHFLYPRTSPAQPTPLQRRTFVEIRDPSPGPCHPLSVHNSPTLLIPPANILSQCNGDQYIYIYKVRYTTMHAIIQGLARTGRGGYH